MFSAFPTATDMASHYTLFRHARHNMFSAMRL